MFNLTKKTQRFASLTFLIAVLTSCGGQAYREPGSLSQPTNNGNTGGVPAGTGTGNGTNTSEHGGNSTGTFLPAVTFSFTMTGAGGTSPTYTTPSVDTDNTLKVRVNAGTAGVVSLPGQYSGFSASYGCISYQITVLGKTLQTQLLATGNPGASCYGAPSSEVLDFSDRLGTSHGPVTIQVSGARYDFYCQMYDSSPYYQWLMGPYRNLYCPSKPVYQNHTVAGSLDIQVNGTSL